MDIGRTLGFCGGTEVKNEYVFSGVEGFTMVLMLTGCRNEIISPPFIVFKN